MGDYYDDLLARLGTSIADQPRVYSDMDLARALTRTSTKGHRRP